MERAGLFANPGTDLRSAVAAGLESLGYAVVPQVPGCFLRQQAERALSVAVVCGLGARERDIADFYAATGARVVMVELPHLRLPGQHRVSPPSHSWLPEFEGGLAPLDRLRALGVEAASRKRVKGQSVLVLGQKAGDSAHGMDGGASRRWAAGCLETLRSLTDSRITWRPHPLDPWELAGADAVSWPAEEGLAAALAGAWAAVTYNSTAGLEALVAGVPVVAEGPAVYSHLALRLNQWARLAPPYPPSVTDLLAAVAYTQWSLEEIAGGAPLRNAVSGAPLPGRPAADGAATSPPRPPAAEEPDGVPEGATAEPPADAAAGPAPEE